MAGDVWKDKEFRDHGGATQRMKPPKELAPLAIGSWFRIQHGDGEDEITWMKVVENLPGNRVVMETRFGHRLTVDRKLVLSPSAKRSARRSGV